MRTGTSCVTQVTDMKHGENEEVYSKIAKSTLSDLDYHYHLSKVTDKIPYRRLRREHCCKLQSIISLIYITTMKYTP